MVKTVMKKIGKKTGGKDTKSGKIQTQTKEETATKGSPAITKQIDMKKIVVPELEKSGADAGDDADSSSDEDKEESTSADQDDQAAIEAALALKKNPKSMNLTANRVVVTKAEKAKRGVLYLGHLPEGFNEPQIKKFFEQFGTVTRHRLCRSQKTGRSRGYGFAEFELKEVAEIVAQTMDKYLLFNRPLDVKLVPAEKCHPALFRKSEKRIFVTGKKNMEVARRRQNNRVIKGEDGKEKVIVTARQQQRRKTQKNKMSALKDFGIEFDLKKIQNESKIPKKPTESLKAATSVATDSKGSTSTGAQNKKKKMVKKKS